MKKRIFVGLSGGVDSSVAAALLKEQGHEVVGVFMKNWSGEDYGVDDLCPWEEDLKDSREAAEHLGIEHKVYNFEKEYRELVIQNFFDEYKLGNTPNPDLLCNKFIKFDYFLRKAKEEGADMIATGHYSRTENGQLFKAVDKNKDQTYFLHQLTAEQLEFSTFPLAELTKPEVRLIAERLNLPNKARKDSQGICFVGKVDIEDFLKNEIKEKKGDVRDIDTNKVVGEHNGIWFYTIGQRKGIGVSGASEAYFVADKNVEENILFVAKGKRHPALWKTVVNTGQFHFISQIPELVTDGLTATPRYRTPDTPVKIQWKEIADQKYAATISFEIAQWTPAAGQSVVLFEKDRCLGGGIIT